MRLSRDAWLGLGLLLLLGLLTVAAALQQTPVIPYLSTSTSPDGTLALKLWLQQLGYQSVDATSVTYQPPASANLIFILEPVVDISEEEWSLLDQWVESGGSLVLAGDDASQVSLAAIGHYGFTKVFLGQPVTQLTLQTPLLKSPPLEAPVPIKLDFALTTSRADFVTYLAVDGQPVLVSMNQGRGHVILSASPFPFSNLGLKNNVDAELVLNLIALSGKSGTFWFDEWHHGVQNVGRIIGPDQWLRATSVGHALLFVVGAIFVALWLQGRGFGRPVPLPREIQRRGPMEHVTAIANLNRKAGHRAAIMKQYHDQLKRRLGRRYRLNPSLPDPEYADSLALYNPSIDKAALLDLLQRLSNRNVGETEMVRLAREVTQWMET